MKTIIFANFKGGVGKTTAAHNVAAYLAKRGNKVVIADLDPQCNLTMSCGQLHTEAASAFDVFEHGTSELIEVQKNLHLLKGSIELATADLTFSGRMRREQILSTYVKTLEGFDYLVCDCPPYLGLITQNALEVADYLFTPIDCEYFSIYGLEYFKKYIDKLGFAVDGIIASRYDKRQILHRDFLENLRGLHNGLLFKTIIPKNIALSEAQASGEDIFKYAPKSSGADAFSKLSREILKLIQ